jgi:hypothetical protein
MTALTSRSVLLLGALSLAGALGVGCSSSDDDESPPCRDCVYPATGGMVSPPSGPVGTGLPSTGGTGSGVGGSNVGTGGAPGAGGVVGGSFGGIGGTMGGTVGIGGDTSINDAFTTGGTFSNGGTLGNGGTTGNPFGTTGGTLGTGGTFGF